MTILYIIIFFSPIHINRYSESMAHCHTQGNLNGAFNILNDRNTYFIDAIQSMVMDYHLYSDCLKHEYVTFNFSKNRNSHYSNVFNYHHRIKGFDTYKAFGAYCSLLQCDVTRKKAALSCRKLCKCQSILSCDNN